MSNFLSQWNSFLNEELLIESRYTDALAFAQNLKKASRTGRVADVYQKMSEEDIEAIQNGLRRGIEYLRETDPSGDDQYLMWGARYLRSSAARLLQRFSERWGTSPEDWANWANTGKTGAAMVAERVVSQALGLSNNLRDYHLLKSKNLIKKDIQDFDPTDYEAFHRWKSDVNKGMQDLADREEIGKLKAKAKESSDTIIEEPDGNYKVVRPYSKEASCHYGFGAKWCISATRSRNYFNQFTNEGKAFYIVFMRHLPNSDPSKMMALVYGRPIEDGEPEEVFNAPNDSVGTDGLKEAVTSNLLAKVVKNLTGNKEEIAKIKKMEDTDKQIQWFNILSDAAAVVISGEEEGAEETQEEILDILGLRQEGYEPDELEDAFQELIYEEYQNIIDETAYHAEKNPATSEDSWQEVTDEYSAQMAHSSIYFEDPEGDGANFYFSGGMEIDVSEESLGVELDPYADSNKVTDQVEHVLDMEFSIRTEDIYFHDDFIHVRFPPDYDEHGLDGYKSFAMRVSEADAEYDNILPALAKAFASAGLIEGGIDFADVEADLEARNLQHAEVDESDGELSIGFPLEYKINLKSHPVNLFRDRPTRDPSRVESPDFIDWFHQEFFGSKGRMDQSIESMLRRVWRRLAQQAQKQMDLPLDEQMSQEEAAKFFDLNPPQINFGDVGVKWRWEMNNVNLTATLEVVVPATATEDYANAVVAYAKYIDDNYDEISEDIYKQLMHDIEQQLAQIPSETKEKATEKLEESRIKEIIKQEVKRYLTEQDGLNVYETFAIVLTDDDTNITDVLTKMRAIEGVTVISTDETVQDGDDNRHEVRVKYLKGGRSVAHYISLLKRSTARIPGVRRFRTMSTKKVNI
tara:strand:+ start:11460 stop:14042 length:2583 start_codon:yes stop_codon:yes gene_type:complete